MIIPTLVVMRQPPVATDLHGQPITGAVTREMVTPVKLAFADQHTTVRTDSAASHGHGYEITSNVVILALPKTKIAIRDILTIYGNKVVVTKVHPRFQVNGKLDHVEVHCSVWK